MLKPQTARSQELATRIGGLDSDKRQQLFRKLGEAGVNVARLPIVPAIERGPLPLSYAQQRQWFLWQLDPQGCAYNLCLALRLRGPLDLAALQGAFDQLLARHASLRTRFLEVDGQALQQVLADSEPDWQVLAAQPAIAAEQLIEARLRDEAATPFDLAQGAPLRVRVQPLGADDHLLQVSLHHIVTDGWSMGVMVEELLECYRAACSGEPALLPVLPIQYSDYALWQRQWLQAGEGERQLQYWRERLGSHQDVLELPLDRPRPVRQSGRGASQSVQLPTALAAALRQLAQRHDVSLFTVLLGSFQLLLQRYTGQPEVRIGVPLANRNRAETERLIGFFVNTQVISAPLDLHGSFSQHLRGLHETVLQAQAHQDLPFEQLVEALQPERNASHSPLFQVMFNHQVQPAVTQGLSLGELQVTLLEQAQPGAQFDLTLDTSENAQGLHACLTYASDLFEAATVARLMRHWQQLLTAIVADPQAVVGNMPLLEDAERQHHLRAWNPATRPFPVTRTLHGCIEEQARRRPQAIAVTCEDRQLSYAELNAQANHWAARLIDAGVGPEVRVGLAVARSLDLVVGLLAILKAGGAYVPMDPSNPRERLAYLMEDSGIALLLTQTTLLERLQPPADLPRVLLDAEPGVSSDPGNPEVAVQPGNLAYVIYTSGSTGKPKGTLLPHENVLRLFAATDSWFGFGADDTWSLFHSHAFDFSVWEVFGALLQGGRLVVVPQALTRSPEEFLALLERERVTVLNQTPSAFRQLMQVACARPEVPTLALRHVVFGGEALEVASLRPWFERFGDVQPQLTNMYGITETTVHVTYRPLSLADLRSDSASPIGEPIPDQTLYLLDAALDPVPQGCIGELYVGSAGLARGYLQRPALSAERFVPDPFGAPGARLYRSGDLARFSQDGAIEYVGRIDHQVKIRGFRVELGEIEARLLQHPQVREAVVLAVDGVNGPQLVAWLVAASELDPAALRESVRAELQRDLPAYMVPSHVLLLDALPLTGNGKLDRRALPQPDATEAQRAYVAPRSAVEQGVAAIWAEILHLPRVGLDDDFFELGGHSLLATQVLSRVRQALAVEASLRTLFEHSGLRDFCAALGAADAVDGETIRAVGRERPLPVSFAQERQWFLWQLDPHSAAYHVPMALRLSGPLDLAALQHSLDALVARHEPLRTTFRQDGGELLQVIADAATLALRQASLPPGESMSARIEAFVLAETQRTFDLANGPLLRACLAPLGSDEHLLVLTQHHIVSDAWSIQRLVHELIELYGAASQGRQAQLAALPIQYADFAQWQRQWLAGPERQRQLEYWQQRLAGGDAVLALPSDFPRPAQMSHRGGQVQVQLPAELVQALRQLAQDQQASLFMLLLASFQLLLHRYSGQADIRVGVPMANRNRVETEALLGFFVNTQVLRVEVQPEACVLDLLQASKAAALDAQANQDLPFEQLVEVLQPQRSLSHNPLFQVIYNHQNRDPRAARLGDLGALQIETVHWDSVTAQVDLALDTFDSGDTLDATLTYATDLFQASTIERLGRHWRNLLQAMVRDPAQRVGQLPMLDRAELEAMRPWSVDEPGYPTARSIHQLIQAQAARRPEALAVICADQQLTFAQLDTQANQLAHLLIARGVGAETLVGVALERSPQMLVALLAVLKAGAAYAPLDLDYPRERLAYLIEDAGISLLLSQSHLAARLPLPEGLECLALDQVELSAQPAQAPQCAVQPGNLAYVIYTSGSTGKPKGVAVAHGPLVMHCLAIGERYEMSEHDCELHFMSFAFDGAHERWLTALSHGARLLIRDGGLWTPEQTYQAMHRHGVTVAAFPPAYLQQLAEHAERDGNPPPVRVYCFGGDAVPQASYDLARRALRPRYIINGYGPTETVVTPLIWKAGEQDACDAAYAPIGTRIGDRSVRVLDDQLERVPLGHPGELYLGGAGLARGYLRRPGLTAERFVPDPHGAPGARTYRSGDLVRQRVDGVVDYLGRVDHQVKVRGFRIELGEIEACLQGVAAVREALVIARQGPTGAQLVGYVVAQQTLDAAGQEALRDQLNLHLKANLPGYMIPSYLMLLEGFALTPNGKIDRKALPEVDASALQRHFVAPWPGLEQQVAEVWQAVLKLERVGRDDNFFELGGHSLLATQATAQLQLALSADIALDLIFKAATLHEYSAALAGCVSADREQDLSDMHDLLDELETL
jgi:amino acid adenylation domain-containing protein